MNPEHAALRSMAAAFDAPSLACTVAAALGIARSGVHVAMMMRSRSVASMPAAARAWQGATVDMSDTSTWLIRRSLIPVRLVIHSSLVSVTVSRSALLSTVGGTQRPHPVIMAFGTGGSSQSMDVDMSASVATAAGTSATEETVIASAPCTDLLASPAVTSPGPTWTKRRTPAAAMPARVSANRTGDVSWATRVPATSPVYGRAGAFAQTGKSARATDAPASASPSCAAAVAMNGEWKAPATFSGMTRLMSNAEAWAGAQPGGFAVPPPRAAAAPPPGRRHRFGIERTPADEGSHAGRLGVGGVGHGASPGGDQSQSVGEGEHSGSPKRGVLAERVPGRCRRCRRHRLGERLPQRVRQRVERRLGVLGAGQRLLGTDEAHRAQRPTEHVVGRLAEEIGACLEEIGSHADVLAPLSREENCVGHRAGPSCACPESGRWEQRGNAGLLPPAPRVLDLETTQDDESLDLEARGAGAGHMMVGGVVPAAKERQAPNPADPASRHENRDTRQDAGHRHRGTPRNGQGLVQVEGDPAEHARERRLAEALGSGGEPRRPEYGDPVHLFIVGGPDAEAAAPPEGEPQTDADECARPDVAPGIRSEQPGGHTQQSGTHDAASRSRLGTKRSAAASKPRSVSRDSGSASQCSATIFGPAASTNLVRATTTTAASSTFPSTGMRWGIRSNGQAASATAAAAAIRYRRSTRWSRVRRTTSFAVAGTAFTSCLSVEGTFTVVLLP